MSGDLEREESPSVAPHGGPIRRLLMKHPFWVATIFGLLFFPTLKLCSIRHTPPSPVLGQVAEATLRDPAGDEVLLPLSLGQPWVVAMLDAEDTRTTPAVLSALRDLRSRVERERVQLPIVVILVPGASEPAIDLIHQRLGTRGDQVYLVTSTEAELNRLGASLEPALGTTAKSLGSVARIGLIDGSGVIRAGAPIGTLGLNELAERAATLERRHTNP